MEGCRRVSSCPVFSSLTGDIEAKLAVLWLTVAPNLGPVPRTGWLRSRAPPRPLGGTRRGGHKVIPPEFELMFEKHNFAGLSQRRLPSRRDWPAQTASTYAAAG